MEKEFNFNNDIFKMLNKFNLEYAVKNILMKIEEIKKIYNLEDLKKIGYIKLIDIQDIEKQIKINLEKKNKVNGKNIKIKKMSKCLVKSNNEKRNEEIEEIKNYLVKLNDEIRNSNMIKDNKIKALSNENIINFVKRKLFVNYAEVLVKEKINNNSNQIHAFMYNVEKSIQSIKSNEDSWLLANNIIKNECIKNTKQVSKDIINLINKWEGNYFFNKTIVKIYNQNSIITNIEEDMDLNKMLVLIDKLILDFIEILDSVIYEEDNKDIIYELESRDVYEKLAKDLGYEKIQLKPIEDRLDVAICTTLEVNETNELEKDLLISKVHRNGFKKGNNVIRRSIVDVYRFKGI